MCEFSREKTLSKDVRPPGQNFTEAAVCLGQLFISSSLSSTHCPQTNRQLLKAAAFESTLTVFGDLDEYCKQLRDCFFQPVP